VQYLRMLSNSIVAACVTTAYVLIIILQLNPTLPLDPSRLAPLVGSVGVFYALNLTATCYALLVLWQLLAHELFSPAWISVRLQAALGSLAAAAGAAVMWTNLETFARVLDAGTVTTMARGAAVLAAASLAFLIAASIGREASAAGVRVLRAFAYVAIAAASVGVPLALRGRGIVPLLEARPLDASDGSSPSERGARLHVIAIDGASLEFVARATADGRLPNFGRILDAGAVMHLATIHPTSAEAVWAAAMTGKLPLKNGVRSARLYHLTTGPDALELLPDYCFAYQLLRFGLLVEEPHTSATLRTRAVWSILSTHGDSVGVVGWPLTEPAPRVRGYVVSDTYLGAAGPAVDSPAVYPSELQRDVTRAVEEAPVDTPPVVQASSATTFEARHGAAGRADLAFDRIARRLADRQQPQVELTRYQGLDSIGHYFLRYAIPAEFGDVSDDQHRALGAVVDRQYGLIDDAIGRAIAALGTDDVLLVVSGYGMEPMGLGRRLVERLIGDPDLNGTHDGAPDGFLMAYGPSVARGRLLARASIVDVTPTILYFLGLPIGRDMDGYARTDLFQRSFTDERPLTFIPTYDR
jgi:predicted AlkP superfamily phosphohydrolase/phosphomutase